VIADELAAAAGEYGRPSDQACSVLLVVSGREPSDTPFVWKHAPVNRGAAVACGVEIGR